MTSLSEGQGIAYYRAGFPEVAKPLLNSEISKESTNRAEACYQLGTIYFEENKVDSASIYFKKGLAAEPSNALNSVGLTMLKIKSNSTVADAEFKTVVKQNKKNVDVYLAVANAYLLNAKLDEALEYQTKARELKPKNALVYVVLGDIELAKKNIGEACRNYEQAIYFDKECKEAYVKYARAYKTVNPRLAVEKLNELKQVAPTFLLASRELAEVYFSSNNFPKAAESYAEYLKSGNISSDDLAKYAFVLFLSNQFKQSLEVTNMGLAKEPLNPVFNRLSMYNNVELNKPADALVAADVFFNKVSKVDLNYTYLDYRYFGQALSDNKQVDLAIPQYEKAVQVDSTKIDTWKQIAELNGKIDKYGAAVKAYEKYMSVLPKDKLTPDVLMDQGRNYYFFASSKDAGTPALKKSYFHKADSVFAIVASKEDNYRGNYWRARANFGLDPETTQGLSKPYYEQTASYVEAKKDTRFNSVLVECYRYLGFYYLQKNDVNQSMDYWNKILAIDPTNDVAKKGIAGIKAMKK